MKSWISFIMPKDEYKETRMLYFFSEGAVLLFLFLMVMAVCNEFFKLSAGTVLLLSIIIFLFYVMGRYILSGIEYTDVATESSFKKEIKNIVTRTGSFTVIFMIMSVWTGGMPENQMKWLEKIGLAACSGLFLFLMNVISLKRSYKRNKDLL
ncbi:DUF3278 domain-containing protein [Bacillus massiliglaciei]|uniref:DUF3278 domain-containing protein n=1 Tax=Bacillus massiliglaciei TaxID=1816693 RepID=UPI000DA60553|nr:DUF3278 domain-containing protein [Bacillus massiliglaciei]